jgi:hypothetical protein
MEKAESGTVFFLYVLAYIKYYLIQSNSVHVLLFTHLFCSEGDLVGSEGPGDDNLPACRPQKWQDRRIIPMTFGLKKNVDQAHNPASDLQERGGA